MGLRAYILKRAIYTIFLIFFVLTINFIIFQVMPGSPIEFFAGRPGALSEARVRDLIKAWGLDRPFHEKYFTYVVNMLTFKFGNSVRPPNKPIVNMISEALPNTILLMGASTILSILIGILTGVIAAYKRGGKIDTTLVISSLVTFSLPTFWMGMIALIVFSRTLVWFPFGHTFTYDIRYPTGLPPPLVQTTIAIPNFLEFAIRIPSLAEVSDRLWHLFLPCAVLTLFSYGNFLLITRATMLETLTEDYIVTARAKGLKERTVIFKHALKNASLPIITSAALALGSMISGAIITETVFNWPGLGSLTYNAIQLYDYPVLHVVFYVIALCVILANFIADLVYGIVDPRIKYG